MIYSLRLYPEDAAWLDDETTKRHCTRAEVLRDLIADARDCYGLPPRLRETLTAAATAEGLSLRDHIAEILRGRAQEASTTPRHRGS